MGEALAGVMSDALVGASAAEVAIARRLLRRLLKGSALRWTSLGSFSGRDGDAVDAERIVARFRAAGWVDVTTRRDKRGTSKPVRLGLTEEGRESAREWLGPELTPPPSRAERVVAALEQWLAEGNDPPIAARVLAQLAAGHTKAVRPRDFAADIERATGRGFDELVSEHTTAVLTAGPVSWRFGGYPVDARAFAPWVAIPEPVLVGMRDLRVDASVLVTVENQTPFEALAASGGRGCEGAPPEICVFTSGFAGRAVRRWIRLLLGSGAISEVWHWGDLDPGGVGIFEDLRALIAKVAPGVPVRPWRMEPTLLRHPAAVALTEGDRARMLQRTISDDSPLRVLWEGMLQHGAKLEQEALLAGEPVASDAGVE